MSKMPTAWTQADQSTTPAPTKVAAGTAVTARIDMSDEIAGKGLCPDCKKPMERAIAGGVESYVCHPDRIAIPVADNLVS